MFGRPERFEPARSLHSLQIIDTFGRIGKIQLGLDLPQIELPPAERQQTGDQLPRKAILKRPKIDAWTHNIIPYARDRRVSQRCAERVVELRKLMAVDQGFRLRHWAADEAIRRADGP